MTSEFGVAVHALVFWRNSAQLHPVNCWPKISAPTLRGSGRSWGN